MVGFINGQRNPTPLGTGTTHGAHCRFLSITPSTVSSAFSAILSLGSIGRGFAVFALGPEALTARKVELRNASSRLQSIARTLGTIHVPPFLPWYRLLCKTLLTWAAWTHSKRLVRQHILWPSRDHISPQVYVVQTTCSQKAKVHVGICQPSPISSGSRNPVPSCGHRDCFDFLNEDGILPSLSVQGRSHFGKCGMLVAAPSLPPMSTVVEQGCRPRIHGVRLQAAAWLTSL